MKMIEQQKMIIGKTDKRDMLLTGILSDNNKKSTTY